MTRYLQSSSRLIPILLAVCLVSCGDPGPVKQEPLHFIVIGDWGMQGNDAQKQVAMQMDNLAASQEIDFIVTTGDNFYPFGVKSPEDPLWQKNYEEVYSLPHIKDIPWYVTLGNHDYFGDFRAELAYAKDHPRWILPANYYSRDFMSGKKILARLLFIDSSPYVEEYQDNPNLYHHIETQNPEAQSAWLERELSDDMPVWKIGIAHHPLYTSGAHGNTDELIQAFAEIFRQHNVQAYFAGHDHHLEHIKTPANTHYFITGGGGAGTRPTGSGEYSLFSLSSHGFAHVALDQHCMHVRFINREGDELYQAVIAADPAQSCDTGVTTPH